MPLFGEYIRELRQKENMTLTKLGGLLGIDSGALSKIERGQKELDIKSLKTLAKVFDLKFEELRTELISEKIARIICKCECSEDVLVRAKSKITLLKNRSTKQASLYTNS